MNVEENKEVEEKELSNTELNLRALTIVLSVLLLIIVIIATLVVLMQDRPNIESTGEELYTITITNKIDIEQLYSAVKNPEIFTENGVFHTKYNNKDYIIFEITNDGDIAIVHLDTYKYFNSKNKSSNVIDAYTYLENGLIKINYPIESINTFFNQICAINTDTAQITYTYLMSGIMKD